jgi:hypothetical protein
MKRFLHKGSGETLIHSLWKIGISGDHPIALFFIRHRNRHSDFKRPAGKLS